MDALLVGASWKGNQTMTTDTCAHCGETFKPTTYPSGMGIPGYGHVPSDPDPDLYWSLPEGSKVCYACCAETDKARMDKDGKATLYLSKAKETWEVTNWPGSLRFVPSVSLHKHGHYSPISGYMERRDAWFCGPSGHLWHGRSIGRWTEIIHCKRLKDSPDNLHLAARLGEKTAPIVREYPLKRGKIYRHHLKRHDTNRPDSIPW